MQELLYTRCNNFFIHGANTSKNFFRFIVDDVHIGFIRRDLWPTLQSYGKNILVAGDTETVTFVPGLVGSTDRGNAVQAIMEAMRDDKAVPCLSGWRNEKYNICHPRTLRPLFTLERSACSLLGVQKFGCHINGFFERNGTTFMWIAVRSPNKQTFAGMFDNMAAGGLNYCMSALECAANECEEEAGVARDFALNNLKPSGAVSYCFEDNRGVHPETEYIFDLRLPEDFVPQCQDGEVASFESFRVEDVGTKEQLLSLVTNPKFKPNSALVVVDFLIRHGFLTESDKGLDIPYAEIVQLLHMRHPFENT